jgi:hypothetical protein
MLSAKSIKKINKKRVWISDTNGRSLFGWKIKEEIFAIFFILVILALANDENIVKKVNDNISIQIFIGFLVIYCIYNRIPWSLAFFLILLISILFSNFCINVKGSFEKIFLDIKEKSKKNSNTNQNLNENLNNNSLINLGARVLGWVSKDKSKLTNNSKSILKKNVSFDKTPEKAISFTSLVERDIEIKKEEKSNIDISDDESDNEVCDEVSKHFRLNDDDGLSDIDTDNETEPDITDYKDEHENLKNSLKSFMKENMKK